MDKQNNSNTRENSRIISQLKKAESYHKNQKNAHIPADPDPGPPL